MTLDKTMLIGEQREAVFTCVKDNLTWLFSLIQALNAVILG